VHIVVRIKDFTGELLDWEQPHFFKAEYDLKRNVEIIGTLKFRSSLGSLATARFVDGCWTFKRLGFLQTRVSIKVCDSDTDIAMFRNNAWSGGGLLELRDGRQLTANSNFWHTRFEFAGEDGQPLVQYHMRNRLRLEGQMEIFPAAHDMPETPWMAMLGWYLAVMMHRDDGAASASFAAT
jgi:hypothetical protein